MKSKKVRLCLSVDQDASCILGSISNEFGLNKSELVEFLLYSAAYNRFGSDGLNSVWKTIFVPAYLDRFTSKFDPEISLKDVVYDCLFESDREV